MCYVSPYIILTITSKLMSYKAQNSINLFSSAEIYYKVYSVSIKLFIEASYLSFKDIILKLRGVIGIMRLKF